MKMASKKVSNKDFTARTSQLNRNWDEAVGPPLDEFLFKLPTHRYVLQRYRAVRTDDPTGVLLNTIK